MNRQEAIDLATAALRGPGLDGHSLRWDEEDRRVIATRAIDALLEVGYGSAAITDEDQQQWTAVCFLVPDHHVNDLVRTVRNNVAVRTWTAHPDPSVVFTERELNQTDLESHCTVPSEAGDACGACDACKADLAAQFHRYVTLHVWTGDGYKVVEGEVEAVVIHEGEVAIGLVGDSSAIYAWRDVAEVR